MKQKDFELLSAKEVEELNNGNEDAKEAWRAGYIYAKREINGYRNSCHMDEYLTDLDNFCEQHLDYFQGCDFLTI